MIRTIQFQFGSSAESEPLQFGVEPVTVFVGPNNSGKSRILVEIERFCRAGLTQDPDNVILRAIQFEAMSSNELKETLDRLGIPEDDASYQDGRTRQVDRLKMGDEANSASLDPKELMERCTTSSWGDFYLHRLLDLFTIRLDGTSRLNLLQERPTGDLKDRPKNYLQKLFQDDDVRLKSREIIFDAFGKYLVIDPTRVGQLNARLSSRQPVDFAEERGWDDRAVQFHRSAIPIHQSSDGVRAFSGIVATILAGDPFVTLIDEPEAFLHPPLAFKLGKEISFLLRNSKKRLFASTHSAHFLMGCIQAGTPLNIIRLTYKDGVATARHLSSDRLLRLMRHPLLRSTGVLNGLFYESVVVTESDADRAFYHEINERLLAANDSRGIPNCLFVNAQNKQTVHEIMRPLREMGIPCAAIVDVDVVKEGGTVWSSLLTSAFFPSGAVASSGMARGNVMSYFDRTDKNFKRNGGVNVLTGSEKRECIDLFDQLDKYGVFTVRHGELENWLSELAPAAKKAPAWLIEIFEKLGEDPGHADYVAPAAGDVWDFIGRVKHWLVNLDRSGIPE